MTKLTKHKKYDLSQLQKEMYKKGELVNRQITSTESEHALGKTLLNAGINVIPQFEVEGRSFDFKVFHYPILIEVDGGVHSQERKRQNDYRKDRFVLRRGFRVMRFSNYEAHNRPDYLIKEVRATIKHLGRSPREVYLYPLTIFEQIKWWFLRFKGKDPESYYHEKMKEDY